MVLMAKQRRLGTEERPAGRQIDVVLRAGGVTDEEQLMSLGVFFLLPDGVQALLHKRNIGRHGIAMPTEHFKRGQNEVRVDATRINHEKNDKAEAQLSMPNADL
jgi:hypothetical protein